MRLAVMQEGKISLGKVIEEVPSIKTIQLKSFEYGTNAKLYKSNVIFHSKAPLMSSNKNTKYDWIENKDESEYPELFSFSTGPACKKVRIKDFYYDARSPILSRDELKVEMKRKIDTIKSKFPNMIAIENTNYYPYPAYDHVCNASFLTEIVEENNIYFTLDIAHAWVTAVNTRTPFYDYLNEFPLDKCIEIHLSKSGEVGRLQRDLHEAPDELEFWILEKVLKNVKLDPYVVVEYTKCQETLIEVYKELERRFI